MSAVRSILTLTLLLLAGLASAAEIRFDNWPLGRIYGSGTHSPGDLITTAGGIQCRADFIQTGAGPAFGDAFVDNAGAAFGSGRVLRFSSIGMEFHYPQVATQTVFAFAQYGGAMNLVVNGEDRWVFGDPTTMHDKEVAPGVIAQVTGGYNGSNFFGTITLVGSVLHFSVGGAELLIDNLTATGVPQPDYTGETGELCDTSVTYESQALGTVWSDPEVFLFQEAGVPVYSWPITDGSEVIFASSEVVANDDGVGQGHEAHMTKSAHAFELREVDLVATHVSWVVHNYSDLVNLQVNGEAVAVASSLDDLPADPAPGVTLTVTTDFTADGVAGLLELDGPVESFRFGGISLDMDNVCFVFGGGPVIGACDRVLDMESLAMGQTWNAGNSAPGDEAFVEAGVPVVLEEFLGGAGYVFGTVAVDGGIPGFDDGQVLHLDDACVEFDLTGLDVVELSLEFRAGPGFENLLVNGAVLVTLDITNFPSAIAPGVTCTVASTNDGFSSSIGKLVLTGPLETVRFGGDDLLLDDVCIRVDNLHTGVEGAAAPALLSPVRAYPNPFNPSTTVDFRLEAAARTAVTIHDVAGRLVRTLVDAELPAGAHSVRWDGADGQGAPAAAGVYFARTVAGGAAQVVKLALIK